MPTAQKSEMDKILAVVSRSLDLSETQYKDAVSKYEAVGAWLEHPKSSLHPYTPKIFPQGSLALGTCVRPIGKDEFDVDLVCEMGLPATVNQEQAKALVGARLAEHETYRQMLEEKNRCWRLDYAGQFHMDILPAKPDDNGVRHRTEFTSDSALLVPDRDLQGWKPSDPQGYARWFDLKKSESASPGALAVAAVEPVPEQGQPREKKPLQVAVQLLKRHRDLYFQHRDDAPISIIITTLASEAYAPQGDLITTLEHLLDRMPYEITWTNDQAYVLNPTNRQENFADKWATEPKKRDAFFEWNEQAKQDVKTLRATNLVTVRDPLAKFAGDNMATKALKLVGEETNALRSSGISVRRSDGRIAAAGTAGATTVPRNTFYGGDDAEE